MRVGLSLSRCVKDIFDGKVDIHDVLVIIARTNVDPISDEHWDRLWDAYTMPNWGSNSEWQGYEHHKDEFRTIILDLYKTGKLHQPRQHGASPLRLEWYWLETLAPEEDVESNPAVKKAWDNYKLLAGLS